MDMYSRISEVSINQIMVFLKCVELENYSKAAEALNYTPSMVSKTVKKLEEKLGLVLFIRRGAHVKPTNAAYQLQREWDAALRFVEAGVEKAYAMQSGGQTTLRVGLIDDSDHAESLFMKCARSIDPDFSSILVEKADMHALPGWLKDGRYDVIITAYHERDQLNGSEYIWRLIEFTKLAIFIPEGHPLFEKDSLSMEDFRPCSFVTMDPLTNIGFYDMFLTACHSWGFEPRVASTVLNSSSMRFSLETGQHLVCGDSILCSWENDRIRKFEIDVPNITGLIVAWCKSREDERILRFADAMCATVGQADQAGQAC